MSFLSPHVVSAILNYRQNHWSVTTSMTLAAGASYGNPRAVIGYDPRNCTSNSSAMTGSPIRVSSPLQADYTSGGRAFTSAGVLFIPDPDTGRFDNFGLYRSPWQFNANVALGYDLSSNTKIHVILANVVTKCFGGSSSRSTQAYGTQYPFCYYTPNITYVSNFYNGVSPDDVGANGVSLNPIFAHPYSPSTSNSGAAPQPFNAYLSVEFRL